MSDWIDPDDGPLLTAELAARAELRIGGKVVRPATGTYMHATLPPKTEAPKRQVTLRLDAQVLDRFRAEGPGWQTRINEALRKAAGL